MTLCTCSRPAEKVGDVVPFSITPHALIALAVSAVTPCTPLSGSSASCCRSTGCHTLRCDPPPGRPPRWQKLDTLRSRPPCAKGRSLVALEMHNLPPLRSSVRRDAVQLARRVRRDAVQLARRHPTSHTRHEEILGASRQSHTCSNLCPQSFPGQPGVGPDSLPTATIKIINTSPP
jgi:hypothetical protein